MAAQLGGGARVTGWRRLSGGLSSAVHRLTVIDGSARRFVVLRQYASPSGATEVTRESSALRSLAGSGLPAPELLAFSVDGTSIDGHPSLLMSRAAGHVLLTPRDPQLWLAQVATAAAAIHDLAIAAPPVEPLFVPRRRRVPASATKKKLWQQVFKLLAVPHEPGEVVFLHRDFQHFNLLWSRERLSGIVDWPFASTGPREVDIGHARLNLAVLQGFDWAERLRLAYEAEVGRTLDPWWDLHELASYDDSWKEFIPIQVAGRYAVDATGMTRRVEAMLEATLRRL